MWGPDMERLDRVEAPVELCLEIGETSGVSGGTSVFQAFLLVKMERELAVIFNKRLERMNLWNALLRAGCPSANVF